MVSQVYVVCPSISSTTILPVESGKAQDAHLGQDRASHVQGRGDAGGSGGAREAMMCSNVIMRAEETLEMQSDRQQ